MQVTLSRPGPPEKLEKGQITHERVHVRLAHRDEDPTDALVTNAEDPFRVGDDDEVDLRTTTISRQFANSLLAHLKRKKEGKKKKKEESWTHILRPLRLQHQLLHPIPIRKTQEQPIGTTPDRRVLLDRFAHPAPSSSGRSVQEEGRRLKAGGYAAQGWSLLREGWEKGKGRRTWGCREWGEVLASR